MRAGLALTKGLSRAGATTRLTKCQHCLSVGALAQVFDRARGWEASMLFVRVVAGVRDRRGRACALGLLLILIALVPLADSSPPDPVWIAGIYDAADSDDAVVVATSLESLAEQGPLGVSPVTTLRYILLVARVGTPTATPPRGVPSRGPPTS